MTTIDVEISRRRLWVGVLAAPVAWVIAESVGYVVSSRLCETAGVIATSSVTARARIAHFALCLICLFIALIGFGAALSSVRAVRALRARDDQRVPENIARDFIHFGRASFMAYGGLFASGLFSLGILLFATPGIVVNVCNQAR
ncbi:MAG TPA: hypothetical protein VGM50_16575 [Gemmatimonadaceae bacterium]|jgi:hypothetical protein